MARRRIVSRHQSGLWRTIGDPTFPKNVDRMHGGNCTLVSRTECTNQATNERIRQPHDGWGLHHPEVEGRPIDCALEWKQDAWQAHDRGVERLTDFRVTTEGGVVLLPSMAPWVLLESRVVPDWWLLFSAAHNNLDNTPKRAAGWLDEASHFANWQRNLPGHWRRARGIQHLHRLHQADVNKNIKQRDERLLVRGRMLGHASMEWGWHGDFLRLKGTHGDTTIDYAFSNMQGESRVMAKSPGFDHNPIQSSWLM